MPPSGIPFSIWDYGLTAVALLLMGGMVYLFFKLVGNHMAALADRMGSVAKVLDDLVQVTRGMRDEFFRLTSDLRDDEIRDQRGRDEVRDLGRPAGSLKRGEGG